LYNWSLNYFNFQYKRYGIPLHAYIVPCICSALARWWPFHGRNM